MKQLSLSRLLRHNQHPLENVDFEKDLEALDLKLLRIQQGVWHRKARVIIAVEGFDAAGKGGVIQRLTEKWDPRGVRVHSIGAPDPHDQAKHYLYRFWKSLPEPGTIAVFDRTWYGRVLVERVEGFTEKKRWREAYEEINAFESILAADGIRIFKIFLGVSKREQLRRYEARLDDPYKQWKLGEEDIRNRKHWDLYVKAVDEMFKKTSTRENPWHLIPADHKPTARHAALHLIAEGLKDHERWMNSKAAKWTAKKLRRQLKDL